MDFQKLTTDCSAIGYVVSYQVDRNCTSSLEVYHGTFLITEQMLDTIYR